VIWWRLILSFGAYLLSLRKWGSAVQWTRPKTHAFLSGPNNNPAKKMRVGILDGSGTEPNGLCCPTWSARGRVSNGPGYPASGLDLDRINCSVWFQNPTTTWPAACWWAKPVSVPINTQGIPNLARPVGSDLLVVFSGISILLIILISYCYMQTINFETSWSVYLVLACFIITMNSDTLPTISRTWVSMECEQFVILYQNSD